jgi:deoxycytidylate deaminase
MVGMFDRTFLHAEIDALIRAEFKATDLYVARVLKDGSPALAKPCPICRLAMKRAGVLRVHYTNNKGTVITEIVK